jgi:hypothetical protein
MLRWGLSGAVITLIFVTYFGLQSRPEVIQMAFDMNAEASAGTFTMTMPVDGQICLMEDLNMRNGGLPRVVQEHWDFEGVHRVAVLDQSDTVRFFLQTPSHRAENGTEPMAAGSRCIPKQTNDAIAVSIGQNTTSTGWWISIN